MDYYSANHQKQKCRPYNPCKPRRPCPPPCKPCKPHCKPCPPPCKPRKPGKPHCKPCPPPCPPKKDPCHQKYWEQSYDWRPEDWYEPDGWGIDDVEQLDYEVPQDSAPESAPRDTQGNAQKMREAILGQIKQMGLKIDEKEIWSFLECLKEAELFAVLGLIALLGYFVLLGLLLEESEPEIV